MAANELLNDDVEVCIDCYFDHHEGRAMKDQSVDWTDNTWQEGDDENGEPSGITDFSSSPCGCCGSHLAGQRFRMATWSKD
jgi:hypothetical protein